MRVMKGTLEFPKTLIGFVCTDVGSRGQKGLSRTQEFMYFKH